MAKSQTTKKKLTGSILALVLCFAMLLGTTFAWFTDTASTNVSKIQAGNLDVALEYATEWDAKNNPTKWENAEGKTLQFRTADGRTENILWEPGSEYWLPDLRIKNNGDLALKFKLDIKGIGGDEKLNEAIEWLSIEGSYGENGETTLGWNNVSDERYDSVTDAEFYLEPGKTADIMLVGYMKTDAGNEYQGLSIDGAAITVLATQYTYEYDSNNNQYDKDADYVYEVKSLTDINNVIKSGSDKIIINDDITVDVAQNDRYSAIRVDKDQGAADEVVLEGTGTVISDKFIIWARGATTVIVKSGNYVSTGDSHLVYVNAGGKVIIEGGTFSRDPGVTAREPFFNMAQAAPNGSIIIKGGLFSKDPSTQIPGSDVWNGTTGIKIEDGYKVVEKDIDGTTWYQVVPK